MFDSVREAADVMPNAAHSTVHCEPASGRRRHIVRQTHTAPVTPMMRRAIGAIMALATCGAASLASAAPINAAKSTVITTSKQMNVAVDGKFKKISGDVSFDPTKPAAGSATVNIDIASYDIGSEEYNDTLRTAEWFDAKTYPQATFVSTSITPAGAGKVTVAGKLTIKGKTQNVTVPLTYTVTGGTQTFDGVLAIRRLAFGIGANEWKDTSVVADEVDIKFHLVVGK